MAYNSSVSLETINDWFSIDGANSFEAPVLVTATGGLGIVKPDSDDDFEDDMSTRWEKDDYDPQEYARKYKHKDDMEALERIIFPTLNDENDPRIPSLYDAEDLTSAGSAPQLAELRHEEARALYQRYNFNHQPAELPILKYRQMIMDSINSTRAIIIQAPTGSGKTTQVPQYILNYFVERNEYCNIVVTQPRRIAAISIAHRVCQERNWPVGKICGYQVSLESEVSDETRLCYMTTGVLLQKLVARKDMNDFTHVILDEVHERDQEIDFVMLAVKKFSRTNSKPVKVILMSATIESAKFAEYFSIALPGRLDPAPVVMVNCHSHIVMEYFLKDIEQLGKIYDMDFDANDVQPMITSDGYKLAHKLVHAFDNLDDKLPNEELPKERGSVLVFLPGIEEITKFQKILNVDAVRKRWNIIPLHSTIPIHEQRRVFDDPRDHYRKIILATNIAESSITVKDIVYVVDFCLTRAIYLNKETNYTSLQLEWATLNNCTQRKGRAGRVKTGRCYRMVSKEFFQRLPQFPIPEMRRCPSEQLVLKAKELNIEDPKSILGLAMDPPDSSDIITAIKTLKEVWALTTTYEGKFSSSNGDMTYVGEMISKLPLDVHLGKLIALGHALGCLENCIIIAASLSLQTFFTRPLKEQMNAYRSKLTWAEDSYSDCIATLNAYKTFQFYKENRYFNRPGIGRSMPEWGEKCFLQINRLFEVEKLCKDIENKLKASGIHLPAHRSNFREENYSDYLILKIAICGAFYPHFATQGTLDEKMIVREISGHDPLSTVVLRGLPANQGVLYTKSIENFFADFSREMVIHFEDTRAYVEFGRKSLKPQENTSLVENRKRKRKGSRLDAHKVLLEVYLAVKMGLLRLPMEIFQYSKEDAERLLKQIEHKTTEHHASLNYLKTNRITTICGDKLEQVPLPGLHISVIELCITKVISCVHFLASYADPQSMFNHQTLEDQIERAVQAGIRLPYDQIAHGVICLAPYEEELGDHRYFRAQIESFDRETAEVIFIDFGNIETVKLHLLRGFDSEQFPDLYKMPKQAFECVLSGVKKSPILDENEAFDMEATNCLRNLSENKKMYATVYSVVHKIVHVGLIKKDDKDDIDVNKLLVDSGYAVNAEESYLSKQNHEFRVRAYESSVYDEASEPMDYETSPFVIKASDIGGGSFRASTRRFKLIGPHNPLEMSFQILLRKTMQQQIKIAEDSVNSVLLDAEPQDTHQRLLVCGHIGLNRNGTGLVARNTTLMPNIHGLFAIISLIFCPYANLRTNFHRTHYTGALCGLGHDEEGKALYPDHDFEFEFDAKFDNVDLINVNVIRYGINLLLGSKDGMDPRTAAKHQKKIQEKFLDLLKKRRSSITIDPNVRRRFRWVIKNKYELKADMDSKEDIQEFLPLISGVQFVEDSMSATASTVSDITSTSYSSYPSQM